MVVEQRDHPVTPSPNIMGRRWGPSAPPAEIFSNVSHSLPSWEAGGEWRCRGSTSSLVRSKYSLSSPFLFIDILSLNIFIIWRKILPSFCNILNSDDLCWWWFLPEQQCPWFNLCSPGARPPSPPQCFDRWWELKNFLKKEYYQSYCRRATVQLIFPHQEEKSYQNSCTGYWPADQ